MLDLRPLEIFLIQFIMYMVLWLVNDFVATLLTLIFGTILVFVLLVSIITELIEPSKVPKSYFKVMFFSVLAPALAAAIYVFIVGGKIDWMIN